MYQYRLVEISAKVGWDPEPRKKKNAVAGMFASRPTVLHGPISGAREIPMAIYARDSALVFC